MGRFFYFFLSSAIVSRETLFIVFESVLKKYPITTEIIVINAAPNLSVSRTVKIQNVIVSISAIKPMNEKYIIRPSDFLKLTGIHPLAAIYIVVSFPVMLLKYRINQLFETLCIL